MTVERVSLVTPLAGHDGGVAVHVMESAAALRRAGHDVTVICARNDSGTSEAVITLPELAQPESAWTQLERALGATRPDVVQIHDLAVPAVVAVAQRFAPTVISAHGYPGCSHNNHYFAPGVECHRAHGPGCFANMALRGCFHARDPRPLPRLYRQTNERLGAYATADAISAYSSAVVTHLGENALQARLVPLFTPLAHRNGPPVPTECARRVLFVGRIVPAKGLDTLLRAMARTDAVLTVVGDGWRREAAEGLVRRLALAGRVRFVGWVTGETLATEYVRSNVVVVPSLWPEPFGLVGIEAMALGRPVVASWTGGVRDWLEPGITGIGVRPGDDVELAQALTRVLDDPQMQASMSAAGRHAVKRRFSEAAHVAALQATFAAAQQQRRARRYS